MSAVLSEQPVFLPESWGNEALSDVVDYFKGRKPTALSEFATDGCQPYLTADYLRSGKASQFATSSSLPSCVLCAPNDPILIWDGSNAGDCFTGAAGALASTMVRLLPDTERLRNDFLFFFLKSQFRFLNRNTTGSTIPHVNRNVFVNLQLPLPSLDEQRRIASVLGVVQRAIEQQERLLQLTAELKKTLLHQLFTQGMRGEPQKQTEIGLVPESWEVTQLGKIATSKSGGTPSRAKPEYWDGGSIPWVKTGEVDYCVIDDSEEKITAAGLANSSAKLFPAGTLLMAMYGQGITRGKVAILGIEAATNQACVAIFPCDDVSTKFLYYFFEGKYEYIRNLGHGANQKNLSAEILKGVTVAYPKNKEEQASVVNSLEALDKKLSLHERKHATLTDLFRTLLHQLMTAQIRVHDLDLPELEVLP